MSTITLQPDVLRWARERRGLSIAQLAKKMSVRDTRVEAWEDSGELAFKQAQKIAQKANIPFGYLFLTAPQPEAVGITDFRTMNDEEVNQPSPELIDTIQTMRIRVDWMREELLELGADPLAFVGRMKGVKNVDTIVEDMRTTLGIDETWAQEEPNWEAALRTLRALAEEVGILVVRNGVVDNSTHRRLEPDEFRGFALVDDYAPLIFINGADAKSAQLFTLAHEMAHLWIGAEGVSNLIDLQPGSHILEKLCNEVAAEFLVPGHLLKAYWPKVAEDETRYQKLSQRFKVSRIVVARRALDLGLITKDAFLEFYDELSDEAIPRRQSSGGSFWNNQRLRVGDRFGRMVVSAAAEGRLAYRDAYRLTGLHRKTFTEYSKRLHEAYNG